MVELNFKLSESQDGVQSLSYTIDGERSGKPSKTTVTYATFQEINGSIVATDPWRKEIMGVYPNMSLDEVVENYKTVLTEKIQKKYQ